MSEFFSVVEFHSGREVAIRKSEIVKIQERDRTMCEFTLTNGDTVLVEQPLRQVVKAMEAGSAW